MLDKANSMDRNIEVISPELEALEVYANDVYEAFQAGELCLIGTPACDCAVEA